MLPGAAASGRGDREDAAVGCTVAAAHSCSLRCGRGRRDWSDGREPHDRVFRAIVPVLTAGWPRGNEPISSSEGECGVGRDLFLGLYLWRCLCFSTNHDHRCRENDSHGPALQVVHRHSWIIGWHEEAPTWHEAHAQDADLRWLGWEARDRREGARLDGGAVEHDFRDRRRLLGADTRLETEGHETEEHDDRHEG